MNDFTKEELETLLVGIGWIHEVVPDSELELKKKLQSMIENYCEHNERQGQQDEDGKLNVVCAICNLQFWH